MIKKDNKMLRPPQPRTPTLLLMGTALGKTLTIFLLFIGQTIKVRVPHH